ncbi:MAG: tetratricopeptide repeat protein, partial [bacterium]|nr:tetratricopeptide repeat protein [bacterium]
MLNKTGLLEKGSRFSESFLWNIQRGYFDRAGASAWRENTVPSYITSNAYTAQAYARVFMGYLRDAMARGEQGLVHIIDVGAGSGQFAFHFLKKLTELYKGSPIRNKIRYRYVFADFTESNINFCSRHPAMQPFIKQGVLDFARLDVADEHPIELLKSGSVLDSDSIPGPLVLIGNYLFDSIPQDL